MEYEMKYKEFLTKLFQSPVFVYLLLGYHWDHLLRTLLRQEKPGKPCAYRLREIAADETNASNASNDGYEIDALSLDSRLIVE